MDKGAPRDGYGQYPQLPSQYDTASGQPYAAPTDAKYGGAPPPNQGYVGPYGHPQQPPMQYGQPYVQQPQQHQQQQYGQQVVTMPPAGQVSNKIYFDKKLWFFGFGSINSQHPESKDSSNPLSFLLQCTFTVQRPRVYTA